MKKVQLVRKFYQEALYGNISKFITIGILSILKVILALIPPIFIIKILDDAIPNNDINNIILFSVIILTAAIFSSLDDILLSCLYCNINKKVQLNLQNKILCHLFNLYGDYYSKMSAGDLMSLFLQDISQSIMLISNTIFSFISDIFIALALFAYLATIQWDLLLCSIPILPFILICEIIVNKKGNRIANSFRDKLGKYTGVIESVTSNILSFIICGNKKFFIINTNNKANDTINEENKLSVLSAKNGAILNTLMTLLTIIILTYGGFKVIRGTLTIGSLMAFYIYIQKLVSPILEVSGIVLGMQSTLVSLERINNFFNVEEIKDLSSVKTNIGDVSKLEFSDIDFSYNKDQDILNNFSATFKKGKFNALIGESGCGKSTLFSLLYRLWDCNNGMISIDNIDIKNIPIKDLRSMITLMEQNNFMFDDTIYNNIAIGNDVDVTQVQKAATIACIDDFIQTLPHKYDSCVGEHGIRLSGGEKQRICIARAILKNSPIIILDEATSALDALTEKKIFNNIREYEKDKIIIVITHRLNPIATADDIFMLKNGCIKFHGTHNDLMIHSEYYRNLWNTQTRSLSENT